MPDARARRRVLVRRWRRRRAAGGIHRPRAVRGRRRGSCSSPSPAPSPMAASRSLNLVSCSSAARSSVVACRVASGVRSSRNESRPRPRLTPGLRGFRFAAEPASDTSRDGVSIELVPRGLKSSDLSPLLSWETRAANPVTGHGHRRGHVGCSRGQSGRPARRSTRREPFGSLRRKRRAPSEPPSRSTTSGSILTASSRVRSFVGPSRCVSFAPPNPIIPAAYVAGSIASRTVLATARINAANRAFNAVTTPSARPDCATPSSVARDPDRSRASRSSPRAPGSSRTSTPRRYPRRGDAGSCS